MVISRWRTGQFVQGRSCRLNAILSFTLHYSINWIYTRQIEESFTFWREKWNMFGRIQPTFVRFSWCFEGKSGICLVVYNLHLITMILFITGMWEWIANWCAHLDFYFVSLLHFEWLVCEFRWIFGSTLWCMRWTIPLSVTWEGMVISRWRTGQFVQGRSCRLNAILSFTLHYSINWIYTRQIEESFTSCIKGLIRKFTEIHILTIQSGVKKRNKNRGEHINLLSILPAHKQNLSTHLWGSRDALKGKVE
jgi:uncharacterized membrane protein